MMMILEAQWFFSMTWELGWIHTEVCPYLYNSVHLTAAFRIGGVI